MTTQEPARADDPRMDAWLAALEARHLADLTASEVTRALRALSSCYVERRDKLATGGALDGAGKRAAFALFYGPQHCIIAREIMRALVARASAQRQGRYNRILDLGCGTGSAGAAAALESGARAIEGIDINPWAVKEAAWTYSTFGLSGRASVGNLRGRPLDAGAGALVLAAYTVNELAAAEDRERMRAQLLAAHDRGAGVLVVEPIARRVNTWWTAWSDAFNERGGRADEWRFRTPLPRRQRELARAAGLSVQELTARSLFLP